MLASPEGELVIVKSEAKKSRVERVATISASPSSTLTAPEPESSSEQLMTPEASAVRAPPFELPVQSRLAMTKLPEGEIVMLPVVEEMVWAPMKVISSSMPMAVSAAE